MKILITGGLGFVGSSLATRFASQGHTVRIFDAMLKPDANDVANRIGRIGDGVGLQVGRLENTHDVVQFIGEHCDADILFHCGGQTAVTKSVENPRNDLNANVIGTLNVLESIRNNADGKIPIINMSTNKVYGSLEYFGENEMVNEHYCVAPGTPYGVSKAAADHYVKDYSNTYGMRTVNLRCSCIYGPSQLGTEDQGWVAWMVERAMDNRPITIFGDGEQVRDILWIDDLVDLFEVLSLGITNSIGFYAKHLCFNAGGGPCNTISVNQLLDMVQSLSGRHVERIYGGPRTGDQRRYVSDLYLIRSYFRWHPKIGFREGIERMVDHHKDNH